MTIEELSDELISYGSLQKMQDMYLYLLAKRTTIYFRKNAQMFKYKEISAEQAQQLVLRFKYLGEMDVGEKRKAQLGAISYLLKGQTQRLRLSTVGDYQGNESLVIRFLYNLNQEKPAYFIAKDAELIQQKIQEERGLYLFSGPTGSGKTTLMYHIAQHTKGQVITIEDPVEIEEPHFLQLQTNEKIQQTYDQLIKLSLRHRPDLLIIGEIRDQLTAKAAIRAALTGHTVLATVHAKGVTETKSRLLDLLGNQAELGDCLNGVIYQQLFLDYQKQSRALLAYEFFTGLLEKREWSEAYAQIQESGLIYGKG
ncbi:competence type IV pilus ATPase ComGA [Tetragenococcus muriaticus]|uniref:ComGA family late competence protein n=2 Tax=Tetragenococcus muriaticus TaxID=64642 RepID=A0A091CEE5_9ENTE|nr:competence type IV pilus ATPase ComGA [Tetragenococcus muriaticus]KFN92928.1 ComGA family late competence protein [Tetragenococcus muriaticus 3MR10-3]KFN93517.1 ComGA family late competence protein [Tetragenococcus muriaticus PMC-11-5]GMA48390.1 competence protein ComGA [Tetragenococcus muriaticus]